MRKCIACNEYKDEGEFYIKHSRSVKNGKEYSYNTPSRKCKKCFGVDVRENSLRRDYGITSADYNEMFDEQEGCCAICGTHQSEMGKRLMVDHDHKTGRVRSLLCHHCNALLGFARDDVNALEAAIRYLRG